MEEKIFTLNIRNATIKVPRWEKSKRGVSYVRQFLKRHMKGDEIKIGQSITEEIWKGGNSNPPKSIRIHAILTEEGEGEEKIKIVKAELLNVPFPEEKEKKKEKKPEEAKKEEKKPEEKPKEVKKEEVKPEEKAAK
jgi:ribosomal protein L31E